MKQEILNMNSVQDYNENLGVETLHPLVSVVNMSELSEIRHSLKRFGFYAVFLKQLDCGTIMYGRSSYDYREGTLMCVAPGQIAGASASLLPTSNCCSITAPVSTTVSS